MTQQLGQIALQKVDGAVVWCEYPVALIIRVQEIADVKLRRVALLHPLDALVSGQVNLLAFKLQFATLFVVDDSQHLEGLVTHLQVLARCQVNLRELCEVTQRHLQALVVLRDF